MQTQPGGSTYQMQFDYERLSRLLDRVRSFMADTSWHTLSEIAGACGGSEASVSARLRDLRKLGMIVQRQRVGDPRRGLFAYRVLPSGVL